MALSSEEAEQYDRQIRLWGLEAQKRLRSSNVLIIGMRGLAAEVAKDVVLAGVKGLTVLDSELLAPDDSGNRFLCFKEGENRALAAVPRLQILNPNVTITADTGLVEDKDDQFFTQFSLVCTTSCSVKTMISINETCRKHGIKFFCGDVWGYYGYFFTDLQHHTFAIEVPKQMTSSIIIEGPSNQRERAQSDEEGVVTEKRNISFCSLEEALNIDWSKKPSRYFRRTPPTFFIIKILQAFINQTGRVPQLASLAEDQEMLRELKKKILCNEKLKDDLVNEMFISHCFSDLSPVCAIVGGVLAQEIIKAISAKDTPLHNMFLYDGTTGSGIVESLSL